MAGAESLKDVTIRPWPTTKSEELSQLDLLVQIEQLTTERGHLRDITEKSLQADIDAGKVLPEDTLQVVATKNEEKKEVSKEERLKEVFRAQQEMAGHLEWAKFAANNTLDLLSLVLSVDPLKSPRGSFTPRFKAEGLEQGIPLGSFGTSKENHDQHVRKPEEIKSLQALEQRQELVAKGSRMEALDTATDEILKAAKKLEREVRRETKYWQEIVSISDKGWPIQRLRPNSRNAPFAVRYGLPEASDHFKALGLAPLQMNKDGSILLHPALALKPKTLRVRIREEEKVTGMSQLTCKSQDEDIAIQETIQLARDSLFEEELFHEMSLETRHLMAYGVESRDAVIYVNRSGAPTQHKRRKIIIDCVPRDENPGDSDGSQDWLAQGVAEGLRLLLAHEHDMRLYQRSQLPPPLSSQKKEKQPPPLLRTLLAVLHHLEGVNSLYSYLDHISKTMCNAGIDAELETTRETTWANLGTTLQQPSKQGLSAANRLLEMFKKPLDGKATLLLHSSAGGQPESLTVSTRTMIGQPTFGTEYKLSLPSSMASDLGLFQQQKLSSVDEAKSYLDWVLSLHVAQRQLKNAFGSRVSFTNNEPRITLRDKADKNKKTSEWHIEVLLADGELKLTAVRAGSGPPKEETSKSQAWSAGTEKKAMKDVIAGWVD